LEPPGREHGQIKLTSWVVPLAAAHSPI